MKLFKKIIKSGLIVMMLITVYGCFNLYRIDYDKQLVTNCPKHAKANETIEFYTVSVDDGDIYVYMNNIELKPVREGYYTFVMPEENVTIKVVIKSNGLA